MGKVIYDTELGCYRDLIFVTFSIKPTLLLKEGVDIKKRHSIKCKGRYEASIAESRLRKVVGTYNIRRSYCGKVKNRGLQFEFKEYFEDRLSA